MKHSLRIAVSLVVSAVFLWFAVRGVSWEETRSALAAAHLVYVIPIILFGYVSLYFRSLRWGVLLAPLARVRQRTLFSATAIGFAGNFLLPLRAGEVLRPWVLARKERMALAPALATVAVERLFDMGVLLLFFAAATLTLPLPPEWRRYGWVFLGTFVVFLGLLGMLQRFPARTTRTLESLLRPLPERVSTTLLHLVDEFAAGLASLKSPVAIALAILYSLLVWSTLAVTFGFALLAFDLPVPPIRGAVSLTTIVAIAVAIPGGPGFIGMFQVGCEVALGVYGIAKSVAFSYSVLLHVVQFASTVALGVYFFATEDLSLKEMRAEASAVVSGEAIER